MSDLGVSIWAILRKKCWKYNKKIKRPRNGRVIREVI
jgi:hypothetical protein